ncbi:peptide deformylase [Alsobacter sp. R-9]
MPETAVLYPDPRLRRPAARVEAFDDALRRDVERLLDGLRTIPARGLAGPHLGIMRRIVAIDLKPGGKPQPLVMVNPEVLSASTVTQVHEEGSVSLPGLHESVERPARVVVGWQTVDGEWSEETFDGFMAACVQHEIEQCDGVFWIARLSRLRRERLLARFDKLNRQGTRPGAAALR